ncbi:MAG: hypothetical protein ACE5Z5_04325 [Candidatus Bathyarchaeia archaeon]
MSEKEEFTIPPEPKEIQKFILALRSDLGPSGGIDWDSLAVWAGNKIPQYLWNSEIKPQYLWKRELKKRGFTWQKFLRLMKYRTDDAILWTYGRISWNDFVKKVIESIEGPLGKAIVER